MTKTYLIVMSARLSRDQVKTFLNDHPSIAFWFFNLPSSMFVRTNLTASALSKLLVEKFGKQRHFITEVVDNRAGLLPGAHWKHL